MTARWIRDLEVLELGPDALDWCRTQPDYATAWQRCERGDWMLWLLALCEVDQRDLVRVACSIARTVLHLVPEGEERPRKAIEAAEGWVRREVQIKVVRAAAYAAGCAADAAAARLKSLSESADIVRVTFPTPPELPR